jgi:hypothetical protein
MPIYVEMRPFALHAHSRGAPGACVDACAWIRTVLLADQPEQAQRALALSQRLSSHAYHQSLIHIDFARSFLQQNSPQEACTFASQALDYVHQTGSKRAFQRILSIRQDLRRWDNIPDMRELDERISLFSKERRSVNSMANDIGWIRERVGHEPVILNFAAAFIVNEQGEILLQKRQLAWMGPPRWSDRIW